MSVGLLATRHSPLLAQTRAKILPMSEVQKTETKPDEKQQPVIHRVCITCNNMFRVTADNYEAKHCPNCHKG